MPIIQASASIPGVSSNDNLLAGSQWEFLPYDSRLDFGLNGDANGADLRIDVYSGTDVLAEGLIPSVQNRAPLWPDDYALNDVAAAGERIKIRVRNLNAVARTLFYAVRITPI
jgi:hypothetical protein